MKITGIIALLAVISVAYGDVVPLKCFLKPDPGPCKASIKKWFFNQRTKQCEMFTYGGCKGVVPFHTEKDCENTCEDPCKQLPDPGPCRGAFPSWFFNQKTRKCEKFIWGGCLGSRPFATLEACENKCSPKDSPKDLCDITPNDVLPKPGTITCQAFFTSWYFNMSSGKCESFSYSACSNLGPFQTVDACEAKCI